MGNRSRGYLVTSGADGKTENDTFTCVHCNAVRIIAHKAAVEDMGGWCFNCAATICPGCAKSGECTPFMRKVEAMEERARLRSAIASN